MGGVDRGRLTCDRNTGIWLPVTLRPNFRGNKATLGGGGRVVVRVWLWEVYRGNCGGLSGRVRFKISFVPLLTSRQPTLRVEGILTCKHMLVLLN